MFDYQKEPMSSIWRWAVDQAVCEVHWDLQNAPRPGQLEQPSRRPDGFVILSILTPLIPLGIDELRQGEHGGSQGEFNVCGPRSMVVSVQAYGPAAFDIASKLSNSLSLRTVLSNFRRVGLAVWDSGEVQNTSGKMETGYERRATLDITFGYSSNVEDRPGFIERVQIQNEEAGSSIDIDAGP